MISGASAGHRLDRGGIIRACGPRQVPAGSASRQLYVDGQEAPIASATPSALGFTGSWTGSSTGYSISR